MRGVKGRTSKRSSVVIRWKREQTGERLREYAGQRRSRGIVSSRYEFDSIRHVPGIQDGGDVEDRADCCACADGDSEVDQPAKILGLGLKFRREFQEVIVRSDNDQVVTHRTREVSRVAGPEETEIGCPPHIDTASFQPLDDCRADTFVSVKLERQGSGSREFGMLRVAGLKFSHQFIRSLPIALNQLLMVEVVGERRMHVCEREVRMCLDHFPRRHLHLFHDAYDLAVFDVGANDHRSRNGVDVLDRGSSEHDSVSLADFWGNAGGLNALRREELGAASRARPRRQVRGKQEALLG